MATKTSEELASFQRFLCEQLQNGGQDISPEQALDLWRAEHPSDEDREETVKAVREALADMEAGDTGRPIKQFHEEMRRKYSMDAP